MKFTNLNAKRIFLYGGVCIIASMLLFIVYCYVLAATTGLKGRRGGPQDAFRHTYASAVVARYISPQAVLWVTKVFEGGVADHGDRACRIRQSQHKCMDRHNNRLGIQVGLSSAAIYPTALAAAQQAVNIDTDELANEAVILLPEKWDAGF